MTERVTYSVTATDAETRARSGLLSTPRGDVRTPIFMPVGTVGTVKGLEPADLIGLGAEIILGNTYHLHLRPGAEVLEHFGGLHAFMGWQRPVLTDSGGFQFYSLAHRAKVREHGVEFSSHLDGSRHVFTPESVMALQRTIGSDIRMVLDDCPALPATPSRLEEAVARSTRWAERSLRAGAEYSGGTFAIVQGGTDVGLRVRHLEELAGLEVDGRGFEGLAIGGLAVGESQAEMLETLEAVVHRMPEERPRYLMGVGKPGDILRAVATGVDMFDCVLPTRNARTGQVFTHLGALNLRNARHRMVDRPIDEACGCPVCGQYSRGYLAHLFRSKEMLGPRLASIHNLWFYLDLVRRARAAIEDGDYASWMQKTMSRWGEEGGPSMG